MYEEPTGSCAAFRQVAQRTAGRFGNPRPCRCGALAAGRTQTRFADLEGRQEVSLPRRGRWDGASATLVLCRGAVAGGILLGERQTLSSGRITPSLGKLLARTNR